MSNRNQYVSINVYDSSLVAISFKNIILMNFLLNWVQSMLSFFKMRKHVSLKILRFIYSAIFHFYFSCSCLAWDQNCSTIQWIVVLQKRLLELTAITTKELPSQSPIQRKAILKFQDEICFKNNLWPSIFITWFSFSSDQDNFKT